MIHGAQRLHDLCETGETTAESTFVGATHRWSVKCTTPGWPFVTQQSSKNHECTFFRHLSAPRGKTRSQRGKKRSNALSYEFYHSSPSFVRLGSEFVEPKGARSTGEAPLYDMSTHHFSQSPIDQSASNQALSALGVRQFAPSPALYRSRVAEIECRTCSRTSI